MLYIGFFEFINENERKEPRCGSFIYFVEANDPDAAIDAFKKNIKKMARKKSLELYGDITLHSFVELTKLPPEGVLAFFQEKDYDPDDPDFRISCILPCNPSGLRGLEWFEDGKEPKEEDDENTLYEVSTFLTIPAPKKETRDVRTSVKENDLE